MHSTCTACGKPTDTVLYFRGDGEWLTAGLMSLGIEPEQSILMISKLLDCPPGEVFNQQDEEDVPLFVCAKCASQAGYYAPVAPGVPAPIIAR